MRIAKNILQKHLLMRADLRISVQPAARIVQVDVVLLIEPPIFFVSQFVQMTRRFKGRVLGAKSRFSRGEQFQIPCHEQYSSFELYPKLILDMHLTEKSD
jgi:hypothetical protein